MEKLTKAIFALFVLCLFSVNSYGVYTPDPLLNSGESPVVWQDKINGNWTDISNEFVSVFTRQHGEMIITNSTTTVALTQNVDGQVIADWEAGELSNFTFSTNELQYVGTEARPFLVIITLAGIGIGGAGMYDLLLYKNDALEYQKIDVLNISASEARNGEVSKIVNLVQNDTLQFYVRNTDNNFDLRVISCGYTVWGGN